MATYADMCDVRVGDVVRCLRPDDCKGLAADQNYTVSGVVVYSTSQFVQLNEKCSSLEYPTKWFELISRATAPEPEQPAVKHEQSPPLVKWPEPEKQLCSGHLPVGDFFTVEHDPQLVWRVVNGGYISWFGAFTSSAYSVLPHNDTPVRRLKMEIRPQFTVI